MTKTTILITNAGHDISDSKGLPLRRPASKGGEERKNHKSNQGSRGVREEVLWLSLLDDARRQSHLVNVLPILQH